MPDDKRYDRLIQKLNQTKSLLAFFDTKCHPNVVSAALSNEKCNFDHIAISGTRQGASSFVVHLWVRQKEQETSQTEKAFDKCPFISKMVESAQNRISPAAASKIKPRARGLKRSNSVESIESAQSSVSSNSDRRSTRSSKSSASSSSSRSTSSGSSGSGTLEKNRSSFLIKLDRNLIKLDKRWVIPVS